MTRALLLPASLGLSILLSACGPTTSRRTNNNGNNNNSGKDAGASVDLAKQPNPNGDSDPAASNPDLAGAEDPVLIAEDPKTCDEAAANKSYVGCDYWPTAVTNAVLPDFDFTVIVANVSASDATVTVTGPNSVDLMETVPAGTLKKIYLPWVDAINPPAVADREYGIAYPMAASIKSTGAAYHLVSSMPVVVYQFNPLEYKAAGGPVGKKWTMCEAQAGGTADCYSVSNDASLLLPSTAMTGNYRVASSFARGGAGSYFAITATTDGTSVTLKAGLNMKSLAGGGIKALTSGQTATFTMDAGDVVEIVSDPGTTLSPAPDTRELSGSLVQADKPVQVIAGDNCLANPKAGVFDFDPPTCDHVEEIVMPAETLGKKYVVTVPSGPKLQKDTKHTVRIVGNVDGTKLTFAPVLSGVATTIGAGQVIEIDDSASNFIVEGDHEFAVVFVQKSAKIVDATSTAPDQKGDPSLSAAVSVEQYRKNYVFLAPDDYDTSFVDIILPKGASITLDGAPIAGSPATVANSDFQLVRVPLSNAGGGIHTIDADVPIGIQIIGYGSYTSYQYPGGLNLKLIAPPPEPLG